MIQTDNWEAINKDSKGLAERLTYITLFFNDQIYNYTLDLHEKIRKTKYYRHEAKKAANDLKKYMERYNTSLGTQMKIDTGLLAVVTQSMEDDIGKHIGIYSYTISQILLKNGIGGELNDIISKSCVIDMLCQCSKISIRQFYDYFKAAYRVSYNPLEWLEIPKARHYNNIISDALTPKDLHVNLNDEKSVSKAFQAIANNIFKSQIFDKAYRECEDYERQYGQG